jgi:hypothetical protein
VIRLAYVIGWRWFACIAALAWALALRSGVRPVTGMVMTVLNSMTPSWTCRSSTVLVRGGPPLALLVCGSLRQPPDYVNSGWYKFSRLQIFLQPPTSPSTLHSAFPMHVLYSLLTRMKDSFSRLASHSLSTPFPPNTIPSQYLPNTTKHMRLITP